MVTKGSEDTQESIMGWNESNIADQSGKTFIVTGANSGIGFEAARVLADKGATVVLACRSADRGQQALDAVKQQHPQADVALALLDLSDLASIQGFAQRFRRSHGKLDVLINNAGVMVPPFTKTADGFELQFGTNHLGHFALTAQLIDLVTAAKGGRVVTVSSMAHQLGKIDFDNLNAEKSYTKSGAYGQSKLANLLFTYELQRRLQAAGHDTLATAAHPGWTATNLQKTAAPVRLLNPIFGQKPIGGALPTLRAAVDLNVEPASYWGPSGFMEMGGPPKQVKSNKRSHDQAVAAKLWTVSEELTGVSFALQRQRAA